MFERPRRSPSERTTALWRRPGPRGRRAWYLLAALALLAGVAAGAVTLRAATASRPSHGVLAPTDPSVPVRAIPIPEAP